MLSLCAERHFTVAVAESCTGGLLGSRFTAVPGSSSVFLGGTIAYSNDVKVRELGVPAADIAAYGAFSEPVALAMAAGARARFGSTVGIGITGIAALAVLPPTVVHLSSKPLSVQPMTRTWSDFTGPMTLFGREKAKSLLGEI